MFVYLVIKFGLFFMINFWLVCYDKLFSWNDVILCIFWIVILNFFFGVFFICIWNVLRIEFLFNFLIVIINGKLNFWLYFVLSVLNLVFFCCVYVLRFVFVCLLVENVDKFLVEVMFIVKCGCEWINVIFLFVWVLFMMFCIIFVIVCRLCCFLVFNFVVVCFVIYGEFLYILLNIFMNLLEFFGFGIFLFFLFNMIFIVGFLWEMDLGLIFFYV